MKTKSLPNQNPSTVCPACGKGSRYIYETKFPRMPGMYECPECGLCHVNPMPSDRDLDDIYGNSYTNSFEMSERNRLLSRDYYAKFHKFLPIGRVFQFLEIGGCYGWLSDLVRKNNTAEVTMLEPGREAARICAERFGFDTAHGYIETWRPQKRFDVIFGGHVLEHLRDLDVFLEACNKLVVKGGLIIMLTPNASSWKYKRHGKNWGWAGTCLHTIFVTRKAVELFAGRNAFKVVSIKGKIPGWRHYPVGFTGRLSRWFRCIFPKKITSSPVTTLDASKSNANLEKQNDHKASFNENLRILGRPILFTEFFVSALLDRVIGLNRADELLIVLTKTGEIGQANHLDLISGSVANQSPP